jgi:hypothetical protein
VIFDMQNAQNLTNLQNSNIPFLSRGTNPGIRFTVNTAATPRTVTVTGRTGTSQGIRINVNDIANIATPGSTYRITYTGRFPDNPTATARIRRESGGGQSQESFGTATAVGGSFTITITRTYEQIMADRGTTYSLGCNTSGVTNTNHGPNITYTGISIIEITN